MEEKRIVYLVPTLLHLMNCIVTQMTVNKDYPADIVFEDVTDFSAISERLEGLGVFEHVYHFPFRRCREEHDGLTDKAAKTEASHNPTRFFDFPPFAKPYTDLCVNIDSFAPKYFYYGLLAMGMTPTIHFVSEGTGTYALDFANTSRDNMDHAWHGERAFLKNIGNTYMFSPELYTGGSELVRPVQLPSIGTLGDEVHAVLETVFGKAEPVKEKVIFFEGTFWGDGMLTDEMKLFLAIANQVGKENIIVKRHPRNTVDRFTPMGFKVMPQQTIPWEVMIKDIDLSQKLLISVASFTCFSSFDMYGRDSYSLLLKDLMNGRVYFLEDAGYRRFFTTAERTFNRERVISWTPASLNELHLVLDVVEKKIGGYDCAAE